MPLLDRPYFYDEVEAFAHMETVLWANGPECPHCGANDRIGKIRPNQERRVRLGLHKCGTCRRQFTVKVGGSLEHARMPLRKIMQAVCLIACSKKRISVHQLHRVLEVQYKTAWLLAGRIRDAMRRDLAPAMDACSTVVIENTFTGGGRRHSTAAAQTPFEDLRTDGQADSFRRAAVEMGVGESEQTFDRALARVASLRPCLPTA